MTKFWILGTSVSKGQGSKVSREAFVKSDTFQTDWTNVQKREVVAHQDRPQSVVREIC